jgi:hypothetical protein
MSLMGTKNERKQHTAESKAKVALAAIKGEHAAPRAGLKLRRTAYC